MDEIQRAYHTLMTNSNHARDLARAINPTAEFKYGAWCVNIEQSDGETPSSANAKIADVVATHGYDYSHKNVFKHANGKTVSISSIVQNGTNLHLITKGQQ